MGSIRQQLAKLTNEKMDALTEQEIYRSAAFQRKLNTLAASLTDGMAKSVAVTIGGNELGVNTAATDGRQVRINWESDLCRFYTSAESRFCSVMGLFYHEFGHVIFNDFDTDKIAMDTIASGSFFGAEPVPETPEDESALTEMKDALKDTKYAALFKAVYHQLCNSVIDPHDERKMIRRFGFLAEEPLTLTVSAMQALSMNLDDAEKGVADGSISKLSAFYSMLLHYIRFDGLVCIDHELLSSSEIYQAVQRSAVPAELAKETDSVEYRYTQLNKIVLYIWPWIKEELENTKQEPQPDDKDGTESNSDGSNGQNAADQSNSTGGPTPSQIQQVIDQLNQAAERVQQSQAPTGKTSSQARNDAKAEGENHPETPQSPPERNKAPDANKAANSKLLQQIKSEIAGAEAAAQLENEQQSSIQQEIRGIFESNNSAHKDVPMDIKRVQIPSRTAVNKYRETMDEVGQYSKHLQKQFLEIMRDTCMGDIKRHRVFGKMLYTPDLYRADGLSFANKKQPKDYPDMAISILVDQSGSMAGNRILQSMKASILLHDFAKGIGIPVSVYGHTTNGNTVCLTVFSDFDQYTNNDRYRLGEMAASGCNRDGAAVEAVAGRLMARPEKMKLLIVISDGQPNHSCVVAGRAYNYGGNAAMEDIKGIVKKYRRRGVEILGAAIGSDRDVIAKIYGDGFLDITDLSRMPKMLTSLVKKRLLENV